MRISEYIEAQEEANHLTVQVLLNEIQLLEATILKLSEKLARLEDYHSDRKCKVGFNVNGGNYE